MPGSKEKPNHERVRAVQHRSEILLSGYPVKGTNMNDMKSEPVYNGFLTGDRLDQYICFWFSNIGYWGPNNDIYYLPTN